jgi:hypothetical protein
MTTETNKATTRAPAQRTGPDEAEATHTVVMAPGVALDDATAYALEQLSDRQEARLVAQQRTEMALRHAVKAAAPTTSAPDQPDPAPHVDVSGLPGLVQWPGVEPIEPIRTARDAPAPGEFLPVKTDLRFEGGLGADNLTDGTHFFGRRQYNGDDLIRFSVGATSHFELRPENIPGSSTGRYRSAPPADARGQIFGLTGNYLPPFHADDKWCHCFRVLRHSLWQLVGGQWIPLGERQQVDTLIHLENVVQIGTKVVPLSGFMPMPVIDFGIRDRSVSIWAQVEIRFDLDLEGDALITFSPENNPADSVVVRTFGWWTKPI